MTDRERWRVIELARTAAGNNVPMQAELVSRAAANWAPQEIVRFGSWVNHRMLDANRADLLLVVEWVYQTHGLGPVSGDGWEYWRGWLVARGRRDYEAALANADTVAGFFTDIEDFLAGEAMEYAPNRAYRRAVPGAEPPDAIYEPMLIETWPARRLAGELTAAELRSRFPRMTERFGTPPFARPEPPAP